MCKKENNYILWLWYNSLNVKLIFKFYKLILIDSLSYNLTSKWFLNITIWYQILPCSSAVETGPWSTIKFFFVAQQWSQAHAASLASWSTFFEIRIQLLFVLHPRESMLDRLHFKDACHYHWTWCPARYKHCLIMLYQPVDTFLFPTYWYKKFFFLKK